LTYIENFECLEPILHFFWHSFDGLGHLKFELLLFRIAKVDLEGKLELVRDYICHFRKDCLLSNNINK
jgi:hypothetical protein